MYWLMQMTWLLTWLLLRAHDVQCKHSA